MGKSVLELEQQIKANKEKQQNDVIDRLEENINWLLEKANRRVYEPTQHEKEVFDRIATIIDNMKNWF